MDLLKHQSQHFLVILFRAMVNFTDELITLSKNADALYNLPWFILAIVSVAICMYR